MRILLLSLFVLYKTSSALECYTGNIPWGWHHAGRNEPAPEIKTCAEDARCCVYKWDGEDGKTFDCESKCPDFQGVNEMSDELKMDGQVTYCTRAEGRCAFNT